ncbi:AEC family transporter [Nesterenkonia halobia]|uniref:AEC family transporter n=1 Tax=Nesterenkonia halobia TaxID=37922 RepID=A0ABP6RB79_9MICC
MDGILLGFSVVGVLVLTGTGIAGIAPGTAGTIQRGVTPLVYWVTTPCLMVVLVSRADVREIVGLYTPAALVIALLTGGVFAGLGLLLGRRPRDVVAGAMASSYVNAGNIGVPIAVYMVGSTAPVVSVLLAQLLVLAPLYLTLFGLLSAGEAPGEPTSGRRVRRRRARMRTVAGSLLNPVTVGVLIGGTISLTGARPPAPIWEPLRMLGEASIPLMLLIFGMALRQERPFAVREHVLGGILGTACKVVLMPALAWVIGGPLLGLEGQELLGVVIMAALPTAQNVHVFSGQHGMETTVVKDVIVSSSVLALPTVLLLAWLLGA